MAVRGKSATRIACVERKPSGTRRQANRDDRAEGKTLQTHSDLDTITESMLQPDPFVTLKTAVKESDLSVREVIEACPEILQSR